LRRAVVIGALDVVFGDIRSRRRWLMLIGLAGAALFTAMACTPAISVLNAVEGLESRRCC
jgi:K+ transporter